jgi:hypothetical protein
MNDAVASVINLPFFKESAEGAPEIAGTTAHLTIRPLHAPTHATMPPCFA